MSDAELASVILSNPSTYTAFQNDISVADLEFTQTTFTMSVTTYGVLSTGTWTVEGGKVIMTGTDLNPDLEGVISKEGKVITVAFGEYSFVFEKD
jgi:hypothetical protein